MIGIKFSMNKYLNDTLDSPLIETGSFLNDILSVYKIKKNRLATYIGLSVPNFHALLKGRRKINPKIAKKLELIFNIDAQMWLYIETKNTIKKFNATSSITDEQYSIKELIE